MPEDGEVAGLLALMLLTEARRTARVSAGGELVTLVEQDRGTWDAALITEGHRLIRERLAARVAPGRYQILAAISRSPGRCNAKPSGAIAAAVLFCAQASSSAGRRAGPDYERVLLAGTR